jgi:hypothetical protein
MKFQLFLSIVLSASVEAIRPQPEFTLRSPEQMARPLPLKGRPMPEHLKEPERFGKMISVDRPDPDPRPKRPSRPDIMPLKPSPATHHEDVPLKGKIQPPLPERVRSAVRSLHSDHHHDVRLTHHHRDDDGYNKDDDRDVHHGFFPTPKISPVPPQKPKPPVRGDVKPKPKAKPKPNPITKNTLMQESDIDMLSLNVQQQCQMDYARLCSSRSNYLWTQQNVPRLSDPFVVDFFVFDGVMDVDEPQPCDLMEAETDNEDGDNDVNDDGDVDDDDDDDDDVDDDGYYDDDDNEIVDFSPLLRIAQNLFPSLRPTQPFPSYAQNDAPRNIDRPLPVFSRSLEMMEPIIPSLGFGFDGDMCLFDNIDRVSPQCQASIDDLQVYVDDMDFDDDSGCPILPFILLLLFVTLILRCIARRRMLQRQDSLHKTLAAIHASPDLKAKVEAASGIPVPPTLPASRARIAMAQKPWYVKLCCVAGCLATGFLMAVTSLLITGAIVNGIYDNDSDDDDAAPIVVLAILFSVLTVEVLLVRRLRMAVCAYMDSSAPTVTASTGSSSSGSRINGNFRLPEVFQRMRSVQISNLLPSRSRSLSSSSSGPQYEPLLSEEEKDDTEVMMVDVVASAPPARVTTIPVVVSRIDASSNVQSSISML